MNEKEIIEKLIPYQSGGNYFILYKIILNNSTDGICTLTQQELADLMKKSRKFISDSLKILKKNKVLDFGYKQIKILGEGNEK